MTGIVFFLVAMLMCFSLYGWGRLFSRFLKYRSTNIAEVITIGLAAIIFVGGVLNLVHLCYGLTLNCLIGTGVFLTFYFAKPKWAFHKNRSELVYPGIVCVFISIIIGFTIATQLPPSAYNYHDDFIKYFNHPIRMLQTGTLFGSSLSAIGYETLGGQALLHALVLNHFPFSYIYGVDAVFGLLLCLVLSVSMMSWKLNYLPISLLGIAATFVINPLMINVSAIYIGAALIMASILVFHRMMENDFKGSAGLPYALTLGLIYAALIAVKSSFVLYVILQILFFCLLIIMPRICIAARLKFCFQVSMATALFLSPWFLLHLPHYIHKSSKAILAISENSLSEPYIQNIGLLSFNPSFYGPSYAHYSFIALVIFCFSIITLWLARKKDAGTATPLQGIASCGMAASASYFVLVPLGPLLNGYDVSLRLTAPILIAVMPVMPLLLVLFINRFTELRWRNETVALVVLLEVLVLAGFSKDAVARFTQGFENGNVLAFKGLATSERYLAYNNDVLHGTVKAKMQKIQSLVPIGKPFFAWVSVPFYFDFKRNEIFDAEQAGIGNPWSYLPDVEYFIVEYSGYAIPPMSVHQEDLRFPGRHERFVTRKVLSLIETVVKLKQTAEILYDDGGIVVFRVKNSGN